VESGHDDGIRRFEGIEPACGGNGGPGRGRQLPGALGADGEAVPRLFVRVPEYVTGNYKSNATTWGIASTTTL
jgi:hypothetical protein